ncbi:MAG: 5-guanidino-2-oxopentanoate decarboxylase [Rhodospirillaceae bacterium]
MRDDAKAFATTKTCGEVLVELLELYGIDTVFGIPGVHTVEFYRGLKNTKLRHITPRHEQGAGFMADGYARATGKPAACFIITGPGLTNIATPMGQAYADSVPMLVISAVNYTFELGKGEGRLHELPSQQKLMSGLTAFSHTLRRPHDLPGVLADAFAVFRSKRPRPVHIEIPLDVITAEAGHISRKALRTPPRPKAKAAKINEAAKLLKQAKRPMMVLGGGAQDAGASAREVAEKLGAVVLTTVNGKGILPLGHPLSIGSTISVPMILEEMARADVVLAVGTELGETDTWLFEGKHPRFDGKVIRIDIEADQLSINASPDIAIHSDADTALASLAAALGSHTPDSEGPVRAQALRELLQASLTPPQRAHQTVMNAVQEALPDAMIVGDSTQPIYSANLFYEAERPRTYFNSTTGYGTLGYALPAAFGAKLAQKDRPSVAVIGDGGLQFTISELATGVELGLPVVVLVWNNQGYFEIKKYMAERGIPQIGVDIYTPDFLAIARGFGCNAVRAESLDHLKAHLKAANGAKVPTLIEIDEAAALTW